MRELDAAWSAGVYEGEGCIIARPVSGLYQARIIVASSDLDVLERLREVTGVGRINGPYLFDNPLQVKPLYRWNVNGWDKCESLVSEWWHWLGERRIDQALATFALRGVRA